MLHLWRKRRDNKGGTHVKTNQAGVDLIKLFEGFRASAYKLTGESYYTIGYGHSYDSSITSNIVWTQAQAEAQLKKDLAKFETYVTQYAKQYHFTLNANQFSALVSYCYNRGQGGLDELLRHSKTLADVSKNILVYWGSAEHYKTGLLNRRYKEKELFDTPVPHPIVKPVVKPKSVVKPMVKPKPAKPVFHVVASGDTVGELAQHFCSTVSQIQAWNKLNKDCVIRIGQKIRVK